MSEEELNKELFEYLVDRVRRFEDYDLAGVFLLDWYMLSFETDYNKDNEIGDLLAKLGEYDNA